MTVDALTWGVDGLVPYPSPQARLYRESGVWGTGTIAEEFHAIAEANPDRLALATLTDELTYAELDRRTDHIAWGLGEIGLEPGDRVLLQLSNRVETVLAWYGLLKAGLVPVSTLIQHRQHELSGIADLCEPVAHIIELDYSGCDLVALAKEIATGHVSLTRLITVGQDGVPGAVTLRTLEVLGSIDSGRSRRHVEAIQAELRDDSLAVMQLSGGTTSAPKLIPRLQAEYWYNARAYATAMGLDAGGRVAHLLPVVHNAGIVCALHAAHSVGASIALAPHDEHHLLALARRGVITHMLMSPAIGSAVTRSDELRDALRGMRVVVWVLGNMSSELIQMFETETCKVTQMFGMGEGLCMFTDLDAPLELRLKSVGTPISPLDEVRVYEPGTETPVEPGSQGELCCRGPYTIRGYYRSPERNAEAFTADGFYRSGDIVVEIPSGRGRYFALSDRIKDLINRGGEKINAAEVEGLLVAHPDIDRAAVVAMPDERLGERCCAFIVLAEGASDIDLPEVQRYLGERGVAKFKYPERVEIRSDLPVTNVTKLNKVALRREIASILAAESSAASAPAPGSG